MLEMRAISERELETRLRGRWIDAAPDGDFADAFFDFVGDHDGPSLARYVQTTATEEQVLDLLRLRSIYHLKEADPSSWVVPRPWRRVRRRR